MTTRANVFNLFGLCLVLASPVAGQTTPAATKAQKQSRYQIGVMERVLEGAVEHAVTMTRDRLQALLPAEMQLLSENARVRGFRLDGYGLFFDVAVPSFEGTVPWIVRTLDQNALGVDSALKALKTHLEAEGDPNLQQALRRIELQVSPLAVSRTVPARQVGRDPAGSVSAAVVPDVPADRAADPILADPTEAYRGEVKQALMEAMLDHASSLGIGSGESLTVAARRNDDRPRLAPADSDAGTIIIRVQGSDLAAYLARQIPREEAFKRIEVRVF